MSSEPLLLLKAWSGADGDQPKYGRLVFEAILAAQECSAFTGELWRVDDVGVWPIDQAGWVAWHPLTEILAVGSPDPLEQPAMPFPFTARQLAAWMVDGPGELVRMAFGEWGTGPEQDALDRFSPVAGKAREAVLTAFDSGLAPSAQSSGAKSPASDTSAASAIRTDSD